MTKWKNPAVFRSLRIPLLLQPVIAMAKRFMRASSFCTYLGTLALKRSMYLENVSCRERVDARDAALAAGNTA